MEHFKDMLIPATDELPENFTYGRLFKRGKYK
jgi:hypothetical protein